MSHHPNDRRGLGAANAGPETRSAEIRPPIRDAASRAREIRDGGKFISDDIDAYHVDQGSIPDGWSYEWKRVSVYGKDDAANQIKIGQEGWEPVPADRHPGMLLEREGVRLMERPLEITREVEEHNYRLAREPLDTAELRMSEAPPGHGPRNIDPRIAPRVTRTIYPAEIPE